MMRLPGFGPGLKAWKALVLNHVFRPIRRIWSLDHSRLYLYRSIIIKGMRLPGLPNFLNKNFSNPDIRFRMDFIPNRRRGRPMSWPGWTTGALIFLYIF
jgi:hypothetical protein